MPAFRKLVTIGIGSVVLGGILVAPLQAKDWPAYRHDLARSGVTTEQLSTPLHLQWTYQSRHKPCPAWPEPGRELHRLAFDYAYEVVVSDGVAVFGSSADHKVYGLDLHTGRERWSFFTEGPVRFAPAIEDNRVFVASDDGCVYCLSLGTGELIWRFRGGPRRELVFGNEQLISRWPLRSGIAVADGLVYFSAGMWPSEGVYLSALNAKDGSVVWQTREDATRYQKQPHPGSFALLGVAPQGILVGNGKQLFIPTGRNVPAAFERASGAFQYYHSAPDGWGNRWGGTWNFATGDLLIGWRNHHVPDGNVVTEEGAPHKDDGLVVFDAATGKRRQELPGKLRAVVDGDILYASGLGTIGAYDFTGWLDGKGLGKKWEGELSRTYTLIKAGDMLIAGGRDQVTALDANTGSVLWRGDIKGQVRGVAAADGRLLVSTTEGTISCYSANATPTPPVHSATTASDTSSGTATPSQTRARRILDTAGLQAGYCMVFGGWDNALILEMLRQSDLNVFCVAPGPAAAEQARRALDAGGLYGARVVVLDGGLEEICLPDYGADLILLTAASPNDLTSCAARELHRLLRPNGGCLLIDTPVPSPNTTAISADAVAGWLQHGNIPKQEQETVNGLVKIVRAPLPGSGEWSHQYGCAARTGASGDTRVKWPLELLWFGRPGPATIISRHWQGPSPLSVNGRMYITGQRHVSALNAYNGRMLWQREFEKAGRWSMPGKGSNVAADADALYLATGNECRQLCGDTGTTINTYVFPDVPELSDDTRSKLNTWSFLAVDGDAVYGSMGRSESEGTCLFALRKNDGTARWAYVAAGAVSSNAVSVGAKTILLIERISGGDVEAAKRRGKDVAAGKRLVCLDRETGAVCWTSTEKIGSRSTLWLSDGVLVALGGGGLSGYEAETGKLLYNRSASFRRSPVLVNGAVYVNPCAFDLRTGDTKLRDNPFNDKTSPWQFSKSYGCGTIGGAPNVLTFRSGTLGIYGLDGDTGVHNFPAVRAGCCINAIPAAGLLLISPGDAGCSCSYSYQTTLALAPAPDRANWGIFCDRLPSSRIEKACLNLGAPGDRRDSDGRMWLAVPRPETQHRRHDVAEPFRFEFAPGFGPDSPAGGTAKITDSDKPWIYSNGLRGLLSAEIDLDILDRGFATWPAAAAMAVDGVLDEDCWDGYRALSLPEGSGSVTFRYDSENLYVGYLKQRRKDEKGNPEPWKTAVQNADGPVWQDDGVDLFLASLPPSSRTVTETCLHLGLSASGARYDALWRYVSPYGVRDIPKLDITVDGDAADWDGKGLEVMSLPDRRSRMRAREDFDPCFRIGWNDKGLLILAQITDSHVWEHPNTSHLNRGDSVEFFLTPTIGTPDHYQVVATPGATEKQPKARHRFYDRRKGDTHKHGLTLESVGTKVDDGYVIELLLPWQNLNVTPETGFEFGMQVLANDNDQDKRGQFVAQWHPFAPPDHFWYGYQGFRLAEAPDEPVVFTRSENPDKNGYYSPQAPLPFPLKVPPLGATAEDNAFQANWQGAVHLTDTTLSAEIVVPWKTLEELGLKQNTVMLNATSRGLLTAAPVSGWGYERPILVPKTYQEERCFDVCLHFAELDDVSPGERVFDVKIQGKTVLENVDIAKAAPGRNRPLVRKAQGVKATRALTLQLVPKGKSLAASTVPILNAIELLPEK